MSSSDQKKDLEGQVGRLVAFANARGLAVSRAVFEIGSGLNGRRPKLLKRLADPAVQTIVVENTGTGSCALAVSTWKPR